jgi:hypothetical protein
MATLVDCASVRKFGRFHAVAISSGGDLPAREIHWQQKSGQNRRHRNTHTRIEAGVKISNSAPTDDCSFSRLPSNGSQNHATHRKLQAAAGRLNQTAQADQVLTAEQTISTNQSSLQTFQRSTHPFLQATENEQMNEWIEKVRTHLRNEASVDRMLWIVDELERLGISHYFEQETMKCLHYLNRYWSNDYGLGSKSGSAVQEMNATATAFRLLRTHGFDVKEDCFKRFLNEDGEILSENTQQGSDVSAMLNLLRASQTLFPGESVLKKARAFTRNYLKLKLERKECGDHAAQVEYALKFPWYTSLPRLEHRAYLEQFQGDPELLTLASADFNWCQETYRKELEQVTRWNETCKFPDLEFARQKFLECYFSAAATLFEPDMAQARVVWTQCYVLITVLDDYFDNCAPVDELRVFLQAVRAWDPTLVKGLPERAKILFNGLYATVNSIAADAFIAQGRDVSHHLRAYWDRWLTACLTESGWVKSGYVPSFDEYMAIAEVTISLETIVCSAFFFAGEKVTEEALLSHAYQTPLHLLFRVSRILNDITGIERETLEGKKSSVHLYMLEHPEASESDAVAFLREFADSTMQELTKEVLRTTALPKASKRLHLHMAKVFHTFYRDSDAYCEATDLLSESIHKVLFNPVPELAACANRA